MRRAVLSPRAQEALALLGDSIRVARLRREWTVEELAERVGVSRPTMSKVEQGHPSVAIGTVLEAASLVGVPLFTESDQERARLAVHHRSELALLPSSARSPRVISDEF